MSDQTSEPNNNQDSGAEDVISLDNINAILAEEAPEFAGEMSELEKSGSEFQTSDQSGMGVDVDVDLSKETLKAKKDRALKKLFSNPVFKFISRLYCGVQNLFWRIVLWFKRQALSGFEVSKAFAKQAPRTAFEYIKFSLSKFLTWKKSVTWQYSQKTKGEKLLIWSFVFIAGATSYLIYFTMKQDWMSLGEKSLIPSLATVADQSWSYNIKSETTPFLMAFPQPRHSFLFSKIVVHLKKRVSSLNEAMGAFEFFVEVDSKDAARELKGREVQLRDLIQRTAEQFTYESLQSEKGKERLKERIRAELNKELAQGWVKSVFIKFMVTKP